MADEEADTRPLPNKRYSHVQIVYSNKDCDLAKMIYEEFEKMKFICGISHSSDALRETKRDAHELGKSLCAIERTCVVILLFSKSFMESKRCKRESEHAFFIRAKYGKKRINLIPLSIDETRIPKKYESLVQELYIEDKEWSNWWPKVLEAVTRDVNFQYKYQSDKCNLSFKAGGMTEMDYVNLDSDDCKFDSFDFESSIATDEESRSSFCSDDDDDDYGNTVLNIQLLANVIGQYESHPEPDKESVAITEMATSLLKKLSTTSLENLMTLQRVLTPLSGYIVQVGPRNMNGILSNGCGMETYENTLALKWETFEKNLLSSGITLANIVCNDNKYEIHNFLLKFNQEGLENFERHYGTEWQKQFQAFGEKILKNRFRDGEKGRLTYRVKITGHTSSIVKHKVNESAKSLYQKEFTAHCEKYTTYEARLDTFCNWPKRFPRGSSECLAAAGFIYTGIDDTVVCFSCNQSLYGSFERSKLIIDPEMTNASIMASHKFWNPNCTFVREHWTPLMTFMLNIKAKNEKRVPGAATFKDFDSRFRSFNPRVPEALRIELAEAGFFRTSASMEDGEKIFLIICFSCGVSIHIDVVKDIWVEHIRWSPDCKYMHEKKGENYIKKVREMLKGDTKNETKAELLIETIILKDEIR